MSLALTELRRRPSQFVVAVVVLSFLSLLLLFLGGLLDGLYLGSTGAVRAQKADVIVFSSDANDSFLRSRIDAETRTQVEQTQGVTDVGGLGIVLLGASVPGTGDLANVAVTGYELPAKGIGSPPRPGEAFADDTLRDEGVEVGDTLLVGPARSEITVVEFVKDSNFLGQGGLWVDLPTWRVVQNANRPDAFVSDTVVQVLVVRGDGKLTEAIDTATSGATSTLTQDDAVLALPGVEQQEATFNQIIYSTLVVVLAIVGLFFSLLTIERTGLYGVLKAIGASSRRLFAGVTLQAVVIATIAFVIGSLLALIASAALPTGVPLRLTPGRFAFTFISIVVAAVLGSAVSLRRVVRIDPASAIGSST